MSSQDVSGTAAAAGDPCVYATAGWGIHDRRWVGALIDQGYAPAVVSLGRDVPDAGALVLAVAEAAREGVPVLAGPLTSVTSALVDLPARIVGLSWGFDLEELSSSGQSLAWVARLDGLIVDSEENRRVAVAAGLPEDRICFLPWGLDLSGWPMVDPDHRRRTGADPVVLSLRAHEPLYRVDDILSAFAALPTVPSSRPSAGSGPRLVVGHSGSLTGRLRELATELGVDDRVDFIGTVGEDRVRQLLAEASCYVSAAATDGTSVTLLQAMATGTPVVVSDTPGNRGWVQDGQSGALFPTGDVAALGAALDTVLRDFPVREVRRARERVVREADWRANLPRLRAILTPA